MKVWGGDWGRAGIKLETPRWVSLPIALQGPLIFTCINVARVGINQTKCTGLLLITLDDDSLKLIKTKTKYSFFWQLGE